VTGTKGKPDEVVGWLNGTLIQRTHPNFFELADVISQEMQELSVTFCNHKGVADRIKHPKLRADPSAVKGGGFLQIYMYEIHPDHQKKDLGLRMIHETLVFLRGEWTLAVIESVPLGSRWMKWPPSGLAAQDRHRRESRVHSPGTQA
jgi:hypothetical protein